MDTTNNTTEAKDMFFVWQPLGANAERVARVAFPTKADRICYMLKHSNAYAASNPITGLFTSIW